MSLYESTFIIRQDLSESEAQATVDAFAKIVTDAGGKVIKAENWGLRSLAYKINKSKKGHYRMLGIDASAEAIAEINRRARLSEDVVRNLTIKVDEISKEPSAILKEAS